ncbi:MAG: PilN domain-containing protein [Bdellovibrionales bacterium]|nr:PilN domain-containing protein [Bdellovibrionales bacterium]
MIRINLLGEKQDKTGIYAIQILSFAAAVLLCLGGCFIAHSTLTSELASLEGEKAVQQSRLAKLRKQTKKVEELEKMRKLREEKLTTIATLKSRKQGPVRVLADLTESVPERAWLLTVTQKGEMVEFGGIALDNQTVSKFMAALEASDYFHSVDLVRSAQYIRDDVKLQQFALSAKLTSLLNLGKPSTEGATKKDKTAAEREKV